ncbi:unnamed protein product [Peronospora belbahrii]|uniref:Uncharacterized protein n=1 Tax=Peronospora belbahrii TaxID=622444 RepID=A0AAU9KX01_9STRA|nr:unnamed protein product [Peronospora belbahrii]CAH0521545.1 unnamed protein product [Peronospora belbahrii]
MVLTKRTRSVPSSSKKKSCEIRSGMSVQDLKQLTAQRQRLELQARNSSRQTATAAKFSYVSSPSSTCSSSLSSPSPPRHHGDSRRYAAMHGYVPIRRRGLASDKMFVTCGGQEIFFMEGVINAPQGGC